MIGVSTGGRISELLGLLRVGDVYQNGKPVTDLLFDKNIVKGKSESRAVPVNNDGRLAIAALVGWHSDRYGDVDDKRPVFPSRNKNWVVALNRQTAKYIGVNYATAREAVEGMALGAEPY